MNIKDEIDNLRADRATRIDRMREAGYYSGEVWIAMAIIFAGCVVAESLDRVAFMAASKKSED